MSLLMQILVPYLLGVITTLTGWYILSHYYVPKLQFSKSISKTKTNDNRSGCIYRIKVENYGNRDIIDLEFYAKFRIRGLYPQFPGNRGIIGIPLSRSRIYKIKPVKKGEREEGKRDILSIHYDETKEFSKPIYPENIKMKSQNESLLLEDIMRLGSSCTLQIIAFGYDVFSGARKMFESKRYSLADIKEGYFDDKGLDVVENKK